MNLSNMNRSGDTRGIANNLIRFFSKGRESRTNGIYRRGSKCI